MLARITAFELRYQLSSLTFAVVAGAFFLLAFGIISIESATGNPGLVHKNAPDVLNRTVLILMLPGMFIPMAFLATGVLRDRLSGADSLFFTRPMHESEYIVGRFLGGYLVTLLAFAAAPLGLFVGALMPWLDSARVGPVRPLDPLYALGSLAAPSLLVIGAILFTAANVTRSRMGVYTTLIAVFLLTRIAPVIIEVSQLWVSDHRQLAALLDPFGGVAYGLATRTWSPFERNTRLAPLEDLLLWNRLLWTGIGVALVAANAVFFSFRTRPTSLRHRAGAQAMPAATAYLPAAPSPVVPETGLGVALMQLKARLRYELAGMLRSQMLAVLLGLALLFAVGILLLRTNVVDPPIYPVTREMITVVTAAFALFTLAILIYFPADLVWRDRSFRAHEIIDATPTPSAVFVTAKLVAVWVLIAALYATAILAAMGVQLARGWTDLEPWFYVRRLLLIEGWGWCLFGTLSLFVQTLARSRNLGMLIMVAYVGLEIWLQATGRGDNLYQFGGSPPAPMSDLTGDGHFLGPVIWFDVYWSLFSAVLVVLTLLLWRRGTFSPLARRLRALPRQTSPATWAVMGVLLAAFAGVGGYIFYNTHILNTHLSAAATQQIQVDYERRYRAYENQPQPRFTHVSVTVDLFPRQRRYQIRGHLVLQNKTTTPIAQVLIGYPRDAGTVLRELRLEDAVVEKRDEPFGQVLFRLPQPLPPGGERALTFSIDRNSPGFSDEDNASEVEWNGTLIESPLALPWIGFNRRLALQNTVQRKRHGLAPIDRLAPLEDEAAAHRPVLRPDSDWVSFEATVSTEADQIAVAPGYLVRDWTEHGRRTFQYKMDAPMQNFFNILSARYAVAEGEQDGVKLQVFYHPAHAYNVPRMLQAMKDSLALYSREFGPFQYRQMRILEFPAFLAPQIGAQSFPNTVNYSESGGFIADNRNPTKNDSVYQTTAHEIAHQWWGHQVAGADTQGAGMLIESFAEYSRLLLAERRYGPHQMRRLLLTMQVQYLVGRATEPVGELPLYRTENQAHIHYGKGALVMYALRDYLGEATVDRALKRLVAEKRFHDDPYARTPDFLRILREEAGPEYQGLITDLFEKIVFYNLKTQSLAVTKRPDGRFNVKLTVNASKVEADAQGKEHAVPLDQKIDIGLFAQNPDAVRQGSQHVIFFEKRPIHSGDNLIEVVVDRAPAWGGIDPYLKLIDRWPFDNLLKAPRTVAPAAVAPQAGGSASSSSSR